MMNQMNRVLVDVKPRSYEAVIGSGNLADCAEEIETALGRKPSRIFIVTVPPVKKHWVGPATASLKKAGLDIEV